MSSTSNEAFLENLKQALYHGNVRVLQGLFRNQRSKRRQVWNTILPDETFFLNIYPLEKAIDGIIAEAERDPEPIFNFLFKKGVDPTLISEYRISPLMMLLNVGRLDAAYKLLLHHKDAVLPLLTVEHMGVKPFEKLLQIDPRLLEETQRVYLYLLLDLFLLYKVREPRPSPQFHPDTWMYVNNKKKLMIIDKARQKTDDPVQTKKHKKPKSSAAPQDRGSSVSQKVIKGLGKPERIPDDVYKATKQFLLGKHRYS